VPCRARGRSARMRQQVAQTASRARASVPVQRSYHRRLLGWLPLARVGGAAGRARRHEGCVWIGARGASTRQPAEPASLMRRESVTRQDGRCGGESGAVERRSPHATQVNIAREGRRGSCGLRRPPRTGRTCLRSTRARGELADRIGFDSTTAPPCTRSCAMARRTCKPNGAVTCSLIHRASEFSRPTPSGRAARLLVARSIRRTGGSWRYGARGCIRQGVETGGPCCVAGWLWTCGSPPLGFALRGSWSF
jgi:hypothetical protein